MVWYGTEFCPEGTYGGCMGHEGIYRRPVFRPQALRDGKIKRLGTFEEVKGREGERAFGVPVPMNHQIFCRIGQADHAARGIATKASLMQNTL